MEILNEKKKERKEMMMDGKRVFVVVVVNISTNSLLHWKPLLQKSLKLRAIHFLSFLHTQKPELACVYIVVNPVEELRRWCERGEVLVINSTATGGGIQRDRIDPKSWSIFPFLQYLRSCYPFGFILWWLLLWSFWWTNSDSIYFKAFPMAKLHYGDEREWHNSCKFILFALLYSCTNQGQDNLV